jgi:Protein of unknown function (DUF2950)
MCRSTKFIYTCGQRFESKKSYELTKPQTTSLRDRHRCSRIPLVAAPNTVIFEEVVYEKDLGPDTLKIFQSMDRYNPDKTWKVTEDDVEDDSQG